MNAVRTRCRSRAAIRALAVVLPLSLAAAVARSSAALPDAGAADGGAARVAIPPFVEDETLPAFDAEPFPEEKSKPPKPSEWKEAPRVRLSRVSERITDCQAYRVREWIKIHCDRMVAGLRLLAGSTDGIAFWVPEQPQGANVWDLFKNGKWAEVIFPARRGDRRIFQVIDFDFGEYEGWGTQPGSMIEERWPEGAKGPEIALLSAGTLFP